MDLRVPFAVALSAFGASAVVTRPGFDPVTTQIVWSPPSPEDQPVGMDFQARVTRRVLSIPRSTVPTVSVDTLIVVAEEDGGTARRFRVDAIEREESDHTRVAVVRAD